MKNPDHNREIDRVEAEILELEERLDGRAELSTTAPPTVGPIWTAENALALSSLTLGFGVVVIISLVYLIRSGVDTERALRVFGTIIVIVSAVFLVVAGYSDKQIAPVVGLLGTIVGYLLGRASDQHETDQQRR